ncbi:MAG: prepilin-type N-terminal cleavage/methylation domain-containing protein [Xanthomonadales bacterium]|nr:prepilin-type N-terminal cleavage/methylation domain-containing protein [Xanthomonadales bacterium]
MTRQSGFTLVEMLLAMTLVALILGMAYSGLRTSAKAVERGDDLLDRSNRLRIVHQFVRAQLRSVMPLQIPPENDFDEEILTYFEGDESSLHFAGPMPGYLSNGGPHEQRLYFDRGPDGNLELLFDHAPLLRDEEWPEQEEREPVVLLSGIREGHFEYLALDEEGEPDEWQAEWEEPTTIPLMVRIAVEMEPFTRQTWPVLEVRPVLDAATGGRQLQRPFVLPGSRREGSG